MIMNELYGAGVMALATLVVVTIIGVIVAKVEAAKERRKLATLRASVVSGSRTRTLAEAEEAKLSGSER